MTTVQILSLGAICAAFVIFAVVLAWGEHQTRHIRSPRATKLPFVKPQPSGARAHTASTHQNKESTASTDYAV